MYRELLTTDSISYVHHISTCVSCALETQSSAGQQAHVVGGFWVVKWFDLHTFQKTLIENNDQQWQQIYSLESVVFRVDHCAALPLVCYTPCSRLVFVQVKNVPNDTTPIRHSKRFLTVGVLLARPLGAHEPIGHGLEVEQLHCMVLQGPQGLGLGWKWWLGWQMTTWIISQHISMLQLFSSHDRLYISLYHS